MPIQLFEQLLTHLAPAFACYACGDPQEKEGFVALLAHLANPPASAADLHRIPQVPGADAARAFYQSHDGALLYTDQEAQNEGLEILPLREWRSRTQYATDLWNEGDYQDDAMPYGREDFLAIAHVRGATTPIHWVTRGPNAGRVYWWPTTIPPDRKDPPLAASFEQFIEIVCTQPVHFFNELISCYTQFDDGTTVKQWIPKRYLPDRP